MSHGRHRTRARPSEVPPRGPAPGARGSSESLARAPDGHWQAHARAHILSLSLSTNPAMCRSAPNVRPTIFDCTSVQPDNLSEDKFGSKVNTGVPSKPRSRVRFSVRSSVGIGDAPATPGSDLTPSTGFIEHSRHERAPDTEISQLREKLHDLPRYKRPLAFLKHACTADAVPRIWPSRRADCGSVPHWQSTSSQ